MKNFWRIRVGKHNLGDLTFHTVNGIVMIFIAVIMIYPFWNTIAVSLNDAQDTLRGGITLFPGPFQLTAMNLCLRTNSWAPLLSIPCCVPCSPRCLAFWWVP